MFQKWKVDKFIKEIQQGQVIMTFEFGWLGFMSYQHCKDYMVIFKLNWWKKT